MHELLREDLLSGLSVLVAGPGGAPDSLFGAALSRFAPTLDEAGEGGARWVADQGALDALLFDANVEIEDGVEGLRDVLDAAWIACAAAANGSFIPGGRAGRIVLVAPSPAAGEMAAAALAALENLARTLSVEWARYVITITTIVPGRTSRPADVAAVVAYLLSPAGGYFSGTRLDLDALSP